MTTLDSAVPRERLMEPIAASRPGGRLYIHVFCRIDPLLLRISGGRVSGVYAARELQGAERERAWALANDLYAGYAAYRSRTDRRIPVLVLEPCA